MLNKIQDYLTLCKPKVVALILLTVLVGMYLSTYNKISLVTVIITLLGIGLCASSAASFNHLFDINIDSKMLRTKNRPLVHGRVTIVQAYIFSATLSIIGFSLLFFKINALTAYLTLLTFLGYSCVYTRYLKKMTSQNIVIGGLSGATPPLLGWTAVTGHIHPYALILVLIIFTWTPPHFWALSIYRHQDYLNAKIPMLPVTHGINYTKLNIILYSILLVIATLLPVITGMSGLFYAIGAILLNIRLVYWVIRLYKSKENIVAIKTFKFSISYLMLLFILLLADHGCLGAL